MNILTDPLEQSKSLTSLVTRGVAIPGGDAVRVGDPSPFRVYLAVVPTGLTENWELTPIPMNGLPPAPITGRTLWKWVHVADHPLLITGAWYVSSPDPFICDVIDIRFISLG